MSEYNQYSAWNNIHPNIISLYNGTETMMTVQPVAGTQYCTSTNTGDIAHWIWLHCTW
jgi:folate-dependent phosphoribosylglycinamide formyltransferase PurN